MRCSFIAIGSAACCLLLLQVSLVLHWSIHDSVMLRAQSSRKATSGSPKSSSPDHDSPHVLEPQFSTNSSVLDGSVHAHQTDSLFSCIRTNASLTGVVAAVVVITHKRVEYLKMCLESVLEVHARQLDNSQAEVSSVHLPRRHQQGSCTAGQQLRTHHHSHAAH